MAGTGEKIGNTVCDCGDAGTVEWTQSKMGGASGKCLTCGEQRFKRSPKAVDRLRAQLARAGAPANDRSPAGAAKPAAGDGFNIELL